MKKRPDLQGIRGIAIFSVLLYHFFPNTFKNGYVGVDMFFILSGFLMAEILSRESQMSMYILGSFYYRRMKRIVPLYAFFILSTLTISLLIFPYPFFSYNIPYVVRSLAFISNIKTEVNEPTYEELLTNAQVLFTHTWSLSCEVQFYIIAPFLLILPGFLSKQIALSILCAVSYFIFTYLCETGKQELSFNFMPTRVWQFVLGSLCSVANIMKITEESETLIEGDNEIDYLLNAPDDKSLFLLNMNCVTIFLVCVFPLEIYPHYVRLIVSLQTAGLIFSGNMSPKLFLSEPAIVYLGDISYSLYLIHWPVCVFLKQYHFTTIVASLLGIIFSILLAALVSETYEKFYLKLEKPGIIILSGFLYLSCVVLLVVMSPEDNFVADDVSGNDIWINLPENLTTDAVIELNKEFNRWDATPYKCLYENPKWGYCTFNNTNFSGNKRILLIGNSYAGNIGRMFTILKECQRKANEIHMYTLSGCEVLENTGAWVNKCINKTEVFQEIVAKLRPDVLFISTRQMTSMMTVKGNVDTILETEKALLKRIEENVNDKVYILNAIPRPIGGKLTKRINNGLKTGKKVLQDSLWEKSYDYVLARRRMGLLAEQCSRCELIDVMPTFTKNGTFQFYDEDNGLEYFVTKMHFSVYGLQKISPLYSNICNNIK